jgi:hypothetical protein
VKLENETGLALCHGVYSSDDCTDNTNTACMNKRKAAKEVILEYDFYHNFTLPAGW